MAWYDGISNWFSSGDGWAAILGGVSAAASSSGDKDKDKTDFRQAQQLVKDQGEQARRTSAFERDLMAFTKKEDTYNKRIAIDSYGQFSKLQQRVPGYVPKPISALPAKPDPLKY